MAAEELLVIEGTTAPWSPLKIRRSGQTWTWRDFNCRCRARRIGAGLIVPRVTRQFADPQLGASLPPGRQSSKTAIGA
jgi:hypothetical protein